jgi:hypothetical protein
LAAVTYYHDQFVAVGAGGTVVTSPEGAQWQTVASGTTNTLASLAASNDRLVAVGGYSAYDAAYATVATSVDGTNWTAYNLPTNAPLASVTYGNGLFVAVGSGVVQGNLGTVLSSPDGLNWTVHPSGLPFNPATDPNTLEEFKLLAVGYGQGKFIAWGYARYIQPAYASFTITSTDGLHWSGQGTANTMIALTYGQDQFVETRGGSVLTSPDGVTWTQRTTGTGYTLYGLTYGSDQFVAVGEGSIVSSPDGVGWTVRHGGEPYILRSVAYGKGRFVAVGDGGVILQSAPLQLKLEPLVLLPGGSVQGRVSNLMTTNCTVEASSNLLDWTVLTNVTTTNASVPFSDPSATIHTQRFYRARSIAP